jgi:RNA polymerase sigma-70 factor (ECF subfamily)
MPGFLLTVNAVLTLLNLPDWIRWLLPALEEGGAGETDTTGHDEDVRWLTRVAGGDERALQLLFDKWKLPLLSFFYRSLGSHADAEDLTLEVFIRLHRAAGDYRPTAKFSTYLFHIAQNLLRNEYRRRSRKPAQLVPPELFDEVAADTAESNQRMAELEETLQRALERLPEKPRTALLLVHQQQLDYRTAAAVLKTTENALRVLVHRARQLLKTEMEALP